MQAEDDYYDDDNSTCYTILWLSTLPKNPLTQDLTFYCSNTKDYNIAAHTEI